MRMSHFLRRAGFGAAPGEVERRLGDGWEATVRSFVEPGEEDTKLAELDRQIGGLLDFANIDDVRTWWIYRMVHSRRPLVEKMTFFWHGHFATSVGKVGSPFLMAQQNRLFRERALGPFGDLLSRVARDPAMLVWLDGSSNKKARPNENFAREVMELFTVGIGAYTEDDVREAARAFTGWTVRDDAFFFDASQHDDGPKRFLGREGPLDGSDVLAILADHPATARLLCGKLFRFFVHEDPDEKELAPLLAAWNESRGDVRETLRALFLSPAFVSQKAWRARVKSPADYVIGSIRHLGGTITPRQVSSLMARMGQDLFNPPSVKGWDGGKAWISTSTLFERFNFAASVTTARGPPLRGPDADHGARGRRPPRGPPSGRRPPRRVARGARRLPRDARGRALRDEPAERGPSLAVPPRREDPRPEGPRSRPPPPLVPGIPAELRSAR